jgi:hypothetical protein
MSKPKILIQLDCDAQVSTFDSVVAVDSGVEQLFRQAGVTAQTVEPLVHGAMFTRGIEDLKSTAIFVGGSDVDASDSITQKIVHTFFGPMRVSVMADPNGANTTAAAAVISAEMHVQWQNATVAILAGTGPVGQRIAQIVGRQIKELKASSRIRIVSRSMERARQVCHRLAATCQVDCFDPIPAADVSASLAAIRGAQVVFAAGAAGVELLGEGWLSHPDAPALAIDLNAVPPNGIQGIEVSDRGQLRSNTICYGAIGVGGLKMRIHKRCLQSLFEANDRVLLVEEIYQVGKQLS